MSALFLLSGELSTVLSLPGKSAQVRLEHKFPAIHPLLTMDAWAIWFEDALRAFARA
jgi:hypothetical protein